MLVGLITDMHQILIIETMLALFVETFLVEVIINHHVGAVDHAHHLEEIARVIEVIRVVVVFRRGGVEEIDRIQDHQDLHLAVVLVLVLHPIVEVPVKVQVDHAIILVVIVDHAPALLHVVLAKQVVAVVIAAMLADLVQCPKTTLVDHHHLVQHLEKK